MARVIVIDDEELMRELMRQLLEIDNHLVEEAPDGEAGLVLQQENPADLVITDMALPGRDGLSVIAAIKKEFPNTKVIAVSGAGNLLAEELFQEAQELGVSDTFSKPFDVREMMCGITEILKEQNVN